MNIAIKMAIAISLTSILSFSASAELFNTDWLKEGDNLVISDSESSLEFLKLTKTDGLSYQNVVSQLSTTYRGWRVATVFEAVSLIRSATGLTDWGVSSLKRAVDLEPHYLLGMTHMSGGTLAASYFSYGLTSEAANDTNNKMVGIYTYDDARYSEQRNANDAVHLYPGNSSYSTSEASAQRGTWLVRDTSNIENVSAPLAFSSLALLSFGLARRRKQK